MAGRKKQPVDLLIAKGKTNLTKAEIEQRRAVEIKVPSDKIIVPPYLDKTQKAEFKKLSKALLEVNIMTNLDTDSLARFIIAKSNYIKLVALVNGMTISVYNLDDLEKAISLQDKLFKQCRSAANDLGLTITSRCKLVVPLPKKEGPQNEEDAIFGDV